MVLNFLHSFAICVSSSWLPLTRMRGFFREDRAFSTLLRFSSKREMSPQHSRTSGLFFLESAAMDFSAFLELCVSVNARSFMWERNSLDI